jgi:hypothetical protein
LLHELLGLESGRNRSPRQREDGSANLRRPDVKMDAQEALKDAIRCANKGMAFARAIYSMVNDQNSRESDDPFDLLDMVSEIAHAAEMEMIEQRGFFEINLKEHTNQLVAKPSHGAPSDGLADRSVVDRAPVSFVSKAEGL